MQDHDRASDEELAALVRAGDEGAFAVLWSRHSRAGLVAARQFRGLADPEDLVAEAYLQILRAMQRGGGPHEAFRPYLYRTIRNTALNRRRDDRVVPIDAVAELEDPEPGPEDAAVRNTITVRAFRTLPERWQTVLWYTEVEGMEPAEAAPLLGLTANGVAALAYRAREGLKKAWLQAHVNDLRVPAGCRWTTARMGDYVRGALSPVARLRFDRHLESCTRCSILVEEIDDLGHRLAVVLFPLVLGGSAAAGLLAERSIDGWHDPGVADALASSGGGAATAGAAAASVTGALPFLIGGAAVVVATVVSIALAASGVFAPPSDAEPQADPPIESPAPPSPTPEPELPDPVPTPPVVAPPVPPPPPSAPPAPAPPTTVAPTPNTPEPSDPPAPSDPPDPPDPPADTEPPLPAILGAGIDGWVGNNPRPVLIGAGEPGARVELEHLDGPGGPGILGTSIVEPDGGWAVAPDTALLDGEHRIRVTLVDPAGNRSDPVDVTITIDTIALPPVVAALAGEHHLLPDVTGTAEPGATVDVLGAGDELLGRVVAGPDGGWMLPLPDPAAGTQTITAVQTDRAGNTSAASAPSDPIVLARPRFVDPADGAHLPSSGAGTIVEVAFDGEPGRQVEVLLDGVPTGNIHTLGEEPIVRVSPELEPGEHVIAIRYIEFDPRRVGATAVLRFTLD